MGWVGSVTCVLTEFQLVHGGVSRRARLICKCIVHIGVAILPGYKRSKRERKGVHGDKRGQHRRHGLAEQYV